MKPSDFRTLVQQFLDGKLSAEEFAIRYDKSFLDYSGDRMDRKLFLILQDLWEDVDAYSPLWEPEDQSAFCITEPTLRLEAKKALKELDRYLDERRTDDF